MFDEDKKQKSWKVFLSTAPSCSSDFEHCLDTKVIYALITLKHAFKQLFSCLFLLSCNFLPIQDPFAYRLYLLSNWNSQHASSASDLFFNRM